MRPARHRRPVRGPVPRRLQIAQQRLLGHAHADPLQAPVLPRPLHGEQPQQAAAEPGSRRPGPACTARAVARRTTDVLSAPSIPVTSRTSAPSPSPSVPAAACAVLTAATVAGPYSG